MAPELELITSKQDKETQGSPSDQDCMLLHHHSQINSALFLHTPVVLSSFISFILASSAFK